MSSLRDTDRAVTRINWVSTKEDAQFIAHIVNRYERERETMGRPIDSEERRTVLMDVTACHCNGTPLKLAALLEAPLFDFMHDIGGISRHINRDTGKLEDFFVPRLHA